jgi:hypothetical protein
MNRSWLKRIILAILILVPLTAAADGVLPVGQREYTFLYDRLERIQTLRTDLFDYQLGPYRLSDSIPLPDAFTYFRQPIGRKVSLFGLPAGDYVTVRDTRSTRFESFRGGLIGRPARNVFLYGSFTLDEALAADAHYHGKVWRGLAGDVQDAFAQVEFGSFNALVGRFASFWGIRNSIVLSDRHHLDGFGYSYRWGRLAISYRLARLDGLSPERDGVEQYENRYFAAHRIDWHLSPRWRVGAFEAVVFGGPGRQIDLFYLNPLIFFHGSQLNEGTDDNTLVGFDFTLRPMIGWKVYGQVVLDDIQIERSSQADQEPDQYGLTLGTYFADLMPSVDVTASYTRVTNWTFNQVLERNRYLFNGRPLGAVLDNDYHEARVSAISWLNEYLSARLKVSLLHRGEGRVADEFSQPWLEVDGAYGEPFPTGTVDRRYTGSLELAGLPLGFLFVDLEAGVQIARDYLHRSGDNRTLPFARVYVSGLFSTLLDLE